MEKEKLFEALDGLKAYESGATDSGIKDESLRQEVKYYLDELDEDTLRVIMSEFIHQHYESDEALEKGYGVEDIVEFKEWLSRSMGIKIPRSW